MPFADFPLFGPLGERLLHKLNYPKWTFMRDDSWQRKELPGPPSFVFWWASFRVCRTTLLLLDVAPPEILDNRGEMVRSQSFLHDDLAQRRLFCRLHC